MTNLIRRILSGDNRSTDHDRKLINRAKQLGLIAETPRGYLIVISEGMEGFYNAKV